MTYYSSSAPKLTPRPLRPIMVPGSCAPPTGTARAVSVAAFNLIPTPGVGYTTTPISGNDVLALTGTDIATVLHQCGLLNQSGGGTVPITFLSLRPAPGDNAVPPIANCCGPSAPGCDIAAHAPAATGYDNAGFAGNSTQSGRDVMAAPAQRYGTAAPWTAGGLTSQYGASANSTCGGYGYASCRDDGAVAVAPQYRRDSSSPAGYAEAYGSSGRSSDGYSRFPRSQRELNAAPDYSMYGQFDGRVIVRPVTGGTPYTQPYDGPPVPVVDTGVEQRPGSDGSPTQYNVSVRGVPRRTMGARRLSRGAPAARSRRCVSPSPPPRERSPSPVPGDETAPVAGLSRSPTSRRSVVSARSRGRAPRRGSVHEQAMAREALDEAQGILATVREQMDTREDFRQRMGPREVERFKAAVLQLERALDTQKKQPYRRGRSPSLRE
ncbi:uncharacterized protein LOC125940224 [Dermacentor silvarum]|uniref:uncharacterized protein LOC125940224 n=1 Tax=Dermacentor silvarum TaxID=543639 RepID=UPI002100B777|nr:uncharacterized protein LOC125940224 [Dermacentor silvarum]